MFWLHHISKQFFKSKLSQNFQQQYIYIYISIYILPKFAITDLAKEMGVMLEGIGLILKSNSRLYLFAYIISIISLSLL